MAKSNHSVVSGGWEYRGREPVRKRKDKCTASWKRKGGMWENYATLQNNINKKSPRGH